MLQRLGRGLAGLFTALSCWWMAVTFFRTWQAPLAVENGRWVRLGLGILLLELVVVHSGVMLAALADTSGKIEVIINGVSLASLPEAERQRLRKRAMQAVNLFYVPFAACVALTMKSMLLMEIYLAVTISRGIGFLSDPENLESRQFNRSVISLALGLLVLFLYALVPFPAGGISPEVLRQVYPAPGRGAWVEHPERILWAGMIYFGALGLAEVILAMVRLNKRQLPTKPEPEPD